VEVGEKKCLYGKYYEKFTEFKLAINNSLSQTQLLRKLKL